MAYENTGIISKNLKKTKETHPDITGSINVTEAGEYWISGWPKKGAKGSFYSLSLTKKDPQQEVTPKVNLVSAKELAIKAGLIEDDEIPF